MRRPESCPADAVALCDLVVERAIAVAPNGVEGLELPSHLITMSNGQLDFNSIATPVKQQLAELSRNASVAGIAASLSLTWPPETPLQLLSVPVTSSHCCTAGISLLSKQSLPILTVCLLHSQGQYIFLLCCACGMGNPVC